MERQLAVVLLLKFLLSAGYFLVSLTLPLFLTEEFGASDPVVCGPALFPGPPSPAPAL